MNKMKRLTDLTRATARRLLSRAAERYGNVTLAVSISHAGEYASAVCIDAIDKIANSKVHNSHAFEIDARTRRSIRLDIGDFRH